MKKNLLKNERGELSYFSVFVILAVNMLLSFLLLFASVKINCINIRNAAKMELNNVSARIYADTFHSQREANLDSYMADLHLSSAYQDALWAGFINGLEERIELSNDLRCHLPDTDVRGAVSTHYPAYNADRFPQYQILIKICLLFHPCCVYNCRKEIRHEQSEYLISPDKLAIKSSDFRALCRQA